MKNLYKLLLVITTLVTIYQNNVGKIDSIFLIIATIINIQISERFSLTKNFCKYSVLFFMWMAVVFMPAFHLVSHIMNVHEVTQLDIDWLVSFGTKVYLIIVVSWIPFGKISQKKVKSRHYLPIIISDRTVYLLFMFLFFLTAFCYSIGLGKMGNEVVELPFHLSGIINLFRSIVVPMLFATIIENYILRNKKIPKLFFILFVLWTGFETFTWMSKSIILYYTIPFAFILYMYYRPSYKKIVTYSLPVFTVFIIMYPIIELARGVPNNNIIETISIAKGAAKELDNDANPLLIPLNRTFMTGFLMSQDRSLIDDNRLFDFSLAPKVIAYGGAPAFQTRYIDGFPPNAIHSSGSSGLVDPFLHGGKGLSFIFAIIFIFLAALTDRLSPAKYYSLYINCILMVYLFSNYQNVSTLYSADGLQSWFARIVGIIVPFFMNFKVWTLKPNLT